MRSSILGLGLAAFLFAGCGPIQVSRALNRAENALKESRAQGFDRDCPYEITAAEEFVRVARDLAGRSEFQAARDFARRAADLAVSTRELAPRNARQRAVRGGTPAPVVEPGRDR